MTDLVGTVRREEHEGGYSIWVLVHQAVIEWWSRTTGSPVPRPKWLCIESTAPGNCGVRFPADYLGAQEWDLIGTVPGTEAAEAVS